AAVVLCDLSRRLCRGSVARSGAPAVGTGRAPRYDPAPRDRIADRREPGTDAHTCRAVAPGGLPAGGAADRARRLRAQPRAPLSIGRAGAAEGGGTEPRGRPRRDHARLRPSRRAHLRLLEQSGPLLVRAT